MTVTLDTSGIYAIINQADPDHKRAMNARNAERHGGRVLTLDRRDFDVVDRGEGTITVLPG